MVAKVISMNEGLALVLNPDVIALMALQPGMSLEVTTDGKHLIATPISERASSFRAVLQAINEQYASTLEVFTK